MEPLKPPKTFKVYQLIKQTGLLMNYVYVAGTGHVQYGPGFYATRDEAEHSRTLEFLKDTATPKSNYLVFELEVPNPAYHE
jgi:hypothetical protein